MAKFIIGVDAFSDPESSEKKELNSAVTEAEKAVIYYTKKSMEMEI